MKKIKLKSFTTRTNEIVGCSSYRLNKQLMDYRCHEESSHLAEFQLGFRLIKRQLCKK